MGFEILNFENYERKEHFLHYLNNVSCSYSISVNLDITSLLAELKKKKYPFLSRNFICNHDNSKQT